MCNYNDRQYGELLTNVIGLYSGVLDGDTEGRFRTRCLSKAVGTRPWVTTWIQISAFPTASKYNLNMLYKCTVFH